MKEILTKEKFVDLMYRNFGEDIDDETWEAIFDEMVVEFNAIGESV